MNTTAVERMRRSATAAVRARFYASRRARLLAARVRPRALVLVYHRIAHSNVDPFGQAVAPAQPEGRRGQLHVLARERLRQHRRGGRVVDRGQGAVRGPADVLRFGSRLLDEI